jgi:hypothetical protein
MTRTEQDRRKRQMNRRIREVMAVRRGLAASKPAPVSEDPADARDNEHAHRPAGQCRG